MKWDITICFEWDDSKDQTEKIERVKKLIDKIIERPVAKNEMGTILQSQDHTEEAHKFRTTHDKLTGKKIKNP